MPACRPQVMKLTSISNQISQFKMAARLLCNVASSAAREEVTWQVSGQLAGANVCSMCTELA